jgi:hypothetical protein
MKKCFWRGHRSDYNAKTGHMYCVYCGTRNIEKTTLGERILAVLEMVKDVLIGILIFVGIVSLFAVPAVLSDHSACVQFARVNNYSYTWHTFGSGCLVQVNGQWISPSHIYVQDIKEIVH